MWVEKEKQAFQLLKKHVKIESLAEYFSVSKSTVKKYSSGHAEPSEEFKIEMVDAIEKVIDNLLDVVDLLED